MALGSLQPPRADIIQHIYLEDLNALGLAGAERATGCFRWLGGGVYGYFTGLWVAVCGPGQVCLTGKSLVVY